MFAACNFQIQCKQQKQERVRGEREEVELEYCCLGLN